MKPHYFFAAVIPDHIKKTIFEEMSKKQHLFKRYTHPEDYHLTLAFIGLAEETALQKACDNIKKSTELISPFSISLASFGTFGNKKAPRVFWVGTDEPKPLFQLQKQVAIGCREAGLQIDEKPFRPHITTARKWKDPNHSYENKETSVWPSFYLEEVALYETNQHTEPRYTKKWSCQLKDAREDDAYGTAD